ncbi:type II secretion system protein [Pseudoalteromonas sp. SWXJZ94C]|uniref:PulJ/GspJ family protein n=1 Tax=unclassified Pseudoalteromonas TaxID=194690 RepID=UPI00140A5617|nr:MULTISPECIES: type II secretion system protein [unclassified Pseudoalteromonas]MBH0057968.1 type II secretion system protein [Pseudoalteromonas sp. SWXJZ94C]
MYIGSNKCNQSAFTLVEVLVAMVIFSLVMTLSVTSYRYSLSTLTKEDKSYKVKTLTTVKLINKQIRSLIPFIYRTELNEQVPFFEGDSNSVSFITDKPIQVDSPMAVITLSIRNKRLEYCEAEYGSFLLDNITREDLSCESPIIYMQGEGVEFSYFGWKDGFELSNYYSEFFSIAVKPKPMWSNVFSAKKRKILPLYIKINTREQSAIMLKIPQLNSFEQGATNAFEG